MFFIIGRMNEDLLRFAWNLEKSLERLEDVASGAVLKYPYYLGIYLSKFFVRILPDLSVFNLYLQAIHDAHITFYRYTIVSGVSYTVVLIYLSILLFRRKNFK